MIFLRHKSTIITPYEAFSGSPVTSDESQISLGPTHTVFCSPGQKVHFAFQKPQHARVSEQVLPQPSNLHALLPCTVSPFLLLQEQFRLRTSEPSWTPSLHRAERTGYLCLYDLEALSYKHLRTDAVIHPCT